MKNLSQLGEKQMALNSSIWESGHDTQLSDDIPWNKYAMKFMARGNKKFIHPEDMLEGWKKFANDDEWDWPIPAWLDIGLEAKCDMECFICMLCPEYGQHTHTKEDPDGHRDFEEVMVGLFGSRWRSRWKDWFRFKFINEKYNQTGEHGEGCETCVEHPGWGKHTYTPFEDHSLMGGDEEF